MSDKIIQQFKFNQRQFAVTIVCIGIIAIGVLSLFMISIPVLKFAMAAAAYGVCEMILRKESQKFSHPIYIGLLISYMLLLICLAVAFIYATYVSVFAFFIADSGLNIFLIMQLFVTLVLFLEIIFACLMAKPDESVRVS